MQKLVYDNYNKFITATETIKEMKNDVYGMDQDMDSVRLIGVRITVSSAVALTRLWFFMLLHRLKMSEIARSSQALDEALHEKRSQVG